jgi:Cell wall-active antibiotics response LiaF, C-terminal
MATPLGGPARTRRPGPPPSRPQVPSRPLVPRRPSRPLAPRLLAPCRPRRPRRPLAADGRLVPRRPRGPLAPRLLAILLVRGDIGDGGDVALLALVIVGGALLLRNLDGRRRAAGPAAGFRPGPPPPGYPAGPYQSAHGGFVGFGQPPVPPAPPTPPGPESMTMPVSSVGAPTAPPPAAAATAPLYGYPPPLPPPPLLPPPPPPPIRRPEHSLLGRLTLSLVAVALGVLGVFDAAGGHDIAARHYLALTLAVLGAGLLVGTLVGRARWLIWLGVPVTVALIATSTGEVVFRGGAGDRQFAPSTVSAIADRYEVGAGSMTIDLSDVDFTDREVRTDVRVGVGDIEVTVPPTVDVTIRAHAGVGDVKVFGVDYSGTGVTRSITDNGIDGAGGGTLELILNVSLGEVEVFRA